MIWVQPGFQVPDPVFLIFQNVSDIREHIIWCRVPDMAQLPNLRPSIFHRVALSELSNVAAQPLKLAATHSSPVPTKSLLCAQARLILATRHE